MRILVETKHTLSVETRGKGMLLPLGGLIILHLLFLLWNTLPLMVDPTLRNAHSGSGIFVLFVSLCAYVFAAYLALRPFADKLLYTFHGHEKSLQIERHILGMKFQRAVSFEDIEAFEIAPPFEGGFCAWIDRQGKRHKLLRIDTQDEYEVFKQLDLITRKSLRTP